MQYGHALHSPQTSTILDGTKDAEWLGVLTSAAPSILRSRAGRVGPALGDDVFELSALDGRATNHLAFVHRTALSLQLLPRRDLFAFVLGTDAFNADGTLGRCVEAPLDRLHLP